MPKMAFAILIGLVTIPLAWADKAGEDFFERSVRPILAEQCMGCHGAKIQKSSLRLDSKAAILKGGISGPVVIPGKPSESLLVQAIHQKGELKMPQGRKLSSKDINSLEKWVAMGLPWPDENSLAQPSNQQSHWAFSPIRKPKAPSQYGMHPIDAFIQKTLQEKQIKPSPQADKRTLIRRITMDLHGIPPSPEAVKDFSNSKSPKAYEELIDQLLGSTAYGERWARHWLDIARYADNKGYVFFEEKNYPWAWTYRNYVIDALNQDLPYNQFIIEQIAADQSSTRNPKSLAALGFLTVGSHFMGNTHDLIDDRIDVISRGVMGLTVSCARCHDHKYDPIPTEDYYSLYGIFRSSFEPLVPPLWETEPANEEYEFFSAELARKENSLSDFVTQKHRELVKQARERCADYLFAAYEAQKQPPADDFMLLADKGDLNPAMIARWRAFLATTKKKKSPAWQLWHQLSDLEMEQFAQASPALIQDYRENRLVSEAFKTLPKDMKEVAQRYGKLILNAERVWLESPSKEPLADKHLEELRLVLYGPDSPADAPKQMDWGFLSLLPDRASQAEYQKLIKEVETKLNEGPPRSMVLWDSERTYDPRVFLRGHPNRQGIQVPRQFLEILSPRRKPFTQGSGRLELAKAIASRENPLTARVIVNQVWMRHFGRGLVSTPGDFGVRGDPPSHPELLDWLASEFMDNGWSLKKLHKLILTSATYQQESMDRDDCLQKDPENRFLWRQNRRRLEFEPLHDSMLFVSGRLETTVGGPSFRLFTGVPRKALYGFIDRLDFPSLLATFDVPNPNASNPERNSTIVAPQALYLMNGPFVRDAATRLLNAPNIRTASTAKDKLENIMQAMFSRSPSPGEMERALEFLGQGNQQEAWLDLVHGLFLTNEFAFVD
ncbi:MAG: PSD1 and planctomycete cytochrome C domain-containing protein [Gemmataceae bacterium]